MQAVVMAMVSVDSSLFALPYVKKADENRFTLSSPRFEQFKKHRMPVKVFILKIRLLLSSDNGLSTIRLEAEGALVRSARKATGGRLVYILWDLPEVGTVLMCVARFRFFRHHQSTG